MDWDMNQAIATTYNLFIQRLGMRAPLKLIIMLAFVAILLDAAGGSHSSKLYPFGKDAGDLHLPVKDDVSSDMISTPPFPFFGLQVSTLYVSIKCENKVWTSEHLFSSCLVVVDLH